MPPTGFRHCFLAVAENAGSVLGNPGTCRADCDLADRDFKSKTSKYDSLSDLNFDFLFFSLRVFGAASTKGNNIYSDSCIALRSDRAAFCVAVISSQREFPDCAGGRSRVAKCQELERIATDGREQPRHSENERLTVRNAQGTR